MPLKMALEMVRKKYQRILTTGAQNHLSIIESRKKYPSYIGQFTLISFS